MPYVLIRHKLKNFAKWKPSRGLRAAMKRAGVAGKLEIYFLEEVAQARDRFNAGVAGNADVVNASLALTASRTLVNDAETAYQLARVALARATGSVTTLR